MPVLVACGALLSAYVTSWIGINIIFGAFAFGLVMPRKEVQKLRQQICASLENSSRLFLPVFFILTGLSMSIGRDLGVISTRMFTIMVLMAVLTTAITGPLLRLLRMVSLDGVAQLSDPDQASLSGFATV